MSSERSVLAIMIDVVSSELPGVPVIQAAGNLIAADAACTIRAFNLPDKGMSGLSDGSTGIREYTAVRDALEAAWSRFQETVASEGPLSPGAHEALVQALEAATRALNELCTSSST